jgi:anti-sigma factor RsiW
MHSMAAGFRANDEAVLRRYLLGELSDGERESVEARLFENDECSEHLSIVEDVLIDAYVRGELRDLELAHFESHFLSSPRRRERVSLAKAWLVPQAPASPPVRKPVWSWTLAALPIAAALFVAIMGSVFLSFSGRMSQQREESAALRKQIEALRAQAVSRNPVPPDVPAAGRALMSNATPPLSFILLPGMRRNAGRQEQRLVIPPGHHSVELDLMLTDAKPYPSYRVVIQTPEGAEVWGKGQIAPSRDATGLALKVNVPSTVLKEGDYRVMVSGAAASGELDDLNDYYVFHAVVR